MLFWNSKLFNLYITFVQVTIDSLGRRHYMKNRESSSSSSSRSSPSRSQQEQQSDEGEQSEGFRTRTATEGSASLRKRQKLTLAQSLFTPLLPISGLKGLHESDSASIVSCSCYQLAKTDTILDTQQQQQQATEPLQSKEPIK